MGKLNKSKLIPERQFYHNLISKKNFKFILADILNEESKNDKELLEKALIGAVAMIELDCIADIKNECLNKEKTKKHYLKYAELAAKSELVNRDEIKEFVTKIKKHCI